MGLFIKTGALVLVVQGVIIAIAGAVVCLGLPGLFNVPEAYRRQFRFSSRDIVEFSGSFLSVACSIMCWQAHQRYDAINYSQVGGLVLNLGVMWLGFGKGWGLYSLLAGYSASTVFTTLFTLAAAIRLKLLPSGSGWAAQTPGLSANFCLWPRNLPARNRIVSRSVAPSSRAIATAAFTMR